MAQLLLMGTNYVNFIGLNAWTGLEQGFQATRVTEWDEPQAVIGIVPATLCLSRLLADCTWRTTGAS